MIKLNNFAILDSEYGKFILNRHDDYQSRDILSTGRPHIKSELRNILTFANLLPKRCIAVDAGASIGLVAVPLAQAILSRMGTVHAFEIQRMMYYALCGNAALNDLENLIAHNMALGAACGTSPIGKLDYGLPHNFGGFSLVDERHDPVDTIPVVTIDSLNLSSLDFLKIDVEGMEVDVLRGARRSIEDHLPWCWIEHNILGPDVIKSQFRDLKYKFFRMSEANMLCAPASKLASSKMRIFAPEI